MSLCKLSMHTTAKRRIEGDKAMEQQIKFNYLWDRWMLPRSTRSTKNNVTVL
jgi:hypothetical protein